jgi:DNA-binding LacI/PurR family transcriptional regulator
VGCELTLEGARLAAQALLENDKPPTAIIAYDDFVAIGTMHAARGAGIAVPEGVSVVGCDDIDVAAFVEPPLTTVRQPKEEMGALAVELLLRGLEGETGTDIKLPGSLVTRASTTAIYSGGAGP